MDKNFLTYLRAAINQAYLVSEQDAVAALLTRLSDYEPQPVAAFARSLVAAVRAHKQQQSVIDALLHEYQLNTPEGIVLMGVAEALLRIPDAPTQDVLLREKLSAADWGEHQTQSDSALLHWFNGALAASAKIEARSQRSHAFFAHLVSHLGAPLIRSAAKQAMLQLAGQFVGAETIAEALQRVKQNPLERYSYDMLGEAAFTAGDAERYFQAYLDAITQLAAYCDGGGDCYANPGISIKLSALCPRFEPLQQDRAVAELTEKLLYLAKHARAANLSLTVDAEESERLDMSLTIFAAVFCNPVLSAWPGLGLAVQAYQKRALAVIRWLAALAESQRRKIPLRLVKGAYWDSEIKRAQENGLSDYPVFTRKTVTDASYIACAREIFANGSLFYAQFATHNAHTVAAVCTLAKQRRDFEFQRLHGMGEQLYAELAASSEWRIACRVYAPVGNYHDLLPYLVRRLLENGANTSFINRVENPLIAIDDVAADPVAELRKSPHSGIESIVLPPRLYGAERVNSAGLNLSDPQLLEHLQQDLGSLAQRVWEACPLVDGKSRSGEKHPINNPADRRLTVGSVVHADAEAIQAAVLSAASAFKTWRLQPVAVRSACLRKAAELLEEHRSELVSLCIREGGRSIKDALAEVREAVDYCRYYAANADALFKQALKLPGPTGEENRLFHYGRGVFVCISPWNFPLAIFTGQITAALVTGNTVIAKPATQTPLTAMRCVQLLHRAGIPEDVLHFLPGDGAAVGKYLLTAAGIAGVAFTGSTATARFINRQLAEHQPIIVPMIAETGGQNVLIADSSAYAEQLTQDAVQSAFNSAGQRCSALRVLFVQQECADKIIAMLSGAMQQLCVGDPAHYDTDIGPLISEQAAAQLTAHVAKMQRQAKVLYQLALPENLQNGCFFPPTLIELRTMSELEEEIFGPVLHVIRFRSDEIGRVIDAVNAAGYGLTLGIHSRIDAHIRRIQENVRVGNIYVNRNLIGAVVGVQPFGGMGLSGTGPKAGGPGYLSRFVYEQTLTVNTAAIGGNAALLTQDLR
ncbi:MAG: bifunctional proline dehydrogenase/L-glutamate gamma-semialdehyde dehydrogenase PutA [Gammaproteobacteria bacterium]